MSALEEYEKWREECFGPYLTNTTKEKADAAIESLKCCGNCTHWTQTWMECDQHPPTGPEYAEELFPYASDHCHFTPPRWEERTDG